MTMSRARALKRHAPKYHPLAQAHALAALRYKHTWFKTPPAVPIATTAVRHPIGSFSWATTAVRHPIGSFSWAKEEAKRAAEGLAMETEHWADTLLKLPASSLNHGTVRIAGKPYHWRQDYTGQLKLAAGESPW